ncbi:2403_t:CDS:2, partial [Funneliformis geosporum]
REINDTIIVTYMLEYYYLFYADDFANLLKTVSDAYTLCKILNYETYTSIIKNEWHTFVDETTKYHEKHWVDSIIKKFKSPENDPKNTKFTKSKKENNYKLIKHILLFLFIPRWYKRNQDKSKLIKIITKEANDDIFDLPIIEYIINDFWSSANSYYKFKETYTNPLTNEIHNVELESIIDFTDPTDNPFSTFPTSLIATYFWTNGNFVQMDKFNSWSVYIFTIIASILLTLILQNMLIAIMGNIYEGAAAKSKQAVLKYKAIQISDYDDLQHRFDFWRQVPTFVPSKKRIRNFKNAVYLDEHIAGFANELDYDKKSIWKFDNEG